MNKLHRFTLLAAIALALAASTARADESTLDVARFGTVYLYQRSAHPSRVALFVSGDGGWNKGVVDMARTMASRGALVVGIDIRRYEKSLAEEKGNCAYPAADFESLSQAVQKKLAMPAYELPVLVGYSSGATLVYAILAEAPANTFRGAVALGFCPDLDLPKVLCKGNGLTWEMPPAKTRAVKTTYIFTPAPHIEGKFVALQGTSDKVCNPPATERWVHQLNGGEVLMLPEVGHGFSRPAKWQSAFDRALDDVFGQKVVASASAAKPATREGVEDLPLVELPAAHDRKPELAVLLSGDGGWAGIDRDVGGALAAAGVPVVGWNSLQYYWHPRTPETAAADLARILRHYMSAWHEDRAVLMGYSFGADVLPFLFTRLPADLKGKVALVTLLGPSREATFEFHVAEWLHAGGDDGKPTLPEVSRLAGTPLLCVYGEKESDSLCRDLPAGLAQLLPTQGAHHFGGDYKKLAAAVLDAVAAAPAAAARGTG
ncbi:MAG TPA: AcvB/VirJ family lysyl-phosphatidylglycerol hydrolase [Thermoanaerobaculia bacterium]|jgi:type IV secretory pathway VirJ component|nr:AcvB/VirJ family lysyl-phosphatidylglycerol hydrolase [Thermoanaerobaculia bacterium]